MESLLPHAVCQQLAQQQFAVGGAVVYLTKAAGDATIVYALQGRLFLSQSGWLLLSVPNALVRGAFDALVAPGAELPLKDGLLNAHITVMSPADVAKIGGPEKITERGHMFSYTLGPLQECEPAGWKEMSRVWFINVQSPELRNLRKSYGLTPLPADGKHEFHITVATRRKHVLRDNPITKLDATNGPATVLESVGNKAAAAPAEKPKPVIDQLRQLKAESDRRNYPAKHSIARRLLTTRPGDFMQDSQTGRFAGVTHTSSRFKFHVPRELLAGQQTSMDKK